MRALLIVNPAAVTVEAASRAHRVMQILVTNSPYDGWGLPLLPDASFVEGWSMASCSRAWDGSRSSAR
jgi:hypothetical protein